jgi:predicted nucleic acid-binding protein
VATVVLDTDAASRLYRDHVDPQMTRLLVGHSFSLTFVTVAELYLWAEVRSWGERRRHDLEAWLDEVPVLPYGATVARTWGRLGAGSRRRGRPRPINDMWIAACCIASKVPLLTFNTRDFEDFATHDDLLLVPTS